MVSPFSINLTACTAKYLPAGQPMALFSRIGKPQSANALNEAGFARFIFCSFIVILVSLTCSADGSIIIGEWIYISRNIPRYQDGRTHRCFVPNVEKP